jgi:dihydroxy-acid dehydratase
LPDHHRQARWPKNWPISRCLRADQDVIRPIDKALYKQGHLAILKGQSGAGRLRGQDHRPEEPGHYRPGACVRRRAQAMDAILADKIKPGDVLVMRYLGPEGRVPACRKCWRRRPR